MTPLRRRMTGDLQLRGCSDRTVEAGVHAVAQLALFYGTSPDRLSEEQVRDYLLHLSTVQHVAASTHTIDRGPGGWSAASLAFPAALAGVVDDLVGRERELAALHAASHATRPGQLIGIAGFSDS